MLETTSMPSCLALTIRFIFELSPSIASTTTSIFLDRRSSRLWALINELWISILQPGLISLTLSQASFAFLLPMVECRAKSWRLIFVASTLSKSIRCKFPTPVRARASNANDPTAPRPKTATVAFFIFPIARDPRSCSILAALKTLQIPCWSLQMQSVRWPVNF